MDRDFQGSAALGNIAKFPSIVGHPNFFPAVEPISKCRWVQEQLEILQSELKLDREAAAAELQDLQAQVIRVCFHNMPPAQYSETSHVSEHVRHASTWLHLEFRYRIVYPFSSLVVFYSNFIFHKR